MKQLNTVAISLCALIIRTSAWAEEPSKGAPTEVAKDGDHKLPPMKPGPELEKLKWMTRAWKCAGKRYMPPEAGGATVATKHRMTIKAALDNWFYSGEFRSEKSKTMPEMKGQFFWGYDPIAKQYVEMWMDNMGGMARSTSNGWEGDK